jgi:chemosensory pili system protein ChpC
MADEKQQMECVLLPQFESNILLPRSAIVKVIDSDDLDIVVDLQGGMLGKLQWHGWTVPLLSFESITGGAIPKFNRETKSAIVHSLIDDSVTPFIALTLQGSPQAVEVNEKNTKIIPGFVGNDFVKSKVIINSEIEAYIPELPVLVTYALQFL